MRYPLFMELNMAVVSRTENVSVYSLFMGLNLEIVSWTKMYVSLGLNVLIVIVTASCPLSLGLNVLLFIVIAS